MTSTSRGTRPRSTGAGAAGTGKAVHRSTTTRRSREELREIVLAAGRDVLLSEGLGSGAEHLSFKRVLSHVASSQGIRVTNASVIGRIWENQEEFQFDVIRSFVDHQVVQELDDTADALRDVLGTLDVSTPAMRRASLGELIRVTCAQYLQSATTSAATIQMALVTYIAAAKGLGDDTSLIDSFRETSERMTLQYTKLYQAGLDIVGWRVRPGLALRDIAVLFSAIAEGILLHRLVDPDVLPSIVRPRLSDGREVEWSALAVSMDALVDVFSEPDPDWRP
ncbi:MAG: hypothetical protein ABSF84_05470 [Acidimicrobiales bacterium]|jgi:hypothetical protein